jgi:two-component system response regulator YesN
MVRLLIVDDEKIVLDSIQYAVSKEIKKGVEMRFAKTGKEAILVAREFHPDIVFMDINMPGINGIEAMKSIAEILSNVQFVIITAYDLFEYAREGVKHQVYEYIVKPFTPMKIVETLKELKVLVEQEKRDREEILNMRDELARIRPLYSYGLIQILASGSDFVRSISNYFRAIAPYGARFAMVQIHGEYTEQEIKRAERIICLRAKEDGAICGPLINGKILILLPSERQEKDDEKRARELLMDVRTKIEKSQIYLSLGERYENISKMWKSCDQAQFAMRSGHGDFRMYTSTQLKEELNYTECRELILQSIENGEGKMSDAMARINFLPFDVKKEYAVVFFTILVEECTKDRKISNNLILSGFERIHNAQTEAELRLTMMQSYYALMQLGTSNVRNKCIVRAMDYMENNLKENLTLDKVAAELNISESLLGKLLKEHTKKTFQDTLTEIRMNKAKNYISQGKMSIKEICFEVGYNDPNYFSRAFKKVVGISPSEYRERSMYSYL